MAQTKYNFLDNSFTTFENVESPKLIRKSSLFGDEDFSNIPGIFGMSSDGIPIYNNITEEKTEPAKIVSLELEHPNEVPIISTPQYDTDISFEDLLKEEGVHARITSGYRENAKASSGKPSHHSIKGGAYDIVPTTGNFEDLRKEIYGNPRIVAWMKNKNWGILEETTPEIMRKTKATGPHWHFGPDEEARKNFNQNLS